MLLDRRISAAVAMLLSAPVLAADVSYRLEQSLQELPATGSVPVIISYRSDANPFTLRTRLRTEDREFRRRAVPRTLRMQSNAAADRLAGLLQSRGASEIRKLWINNSVSALVTPEIIDELKSDPDVVMIREDAVVESPFPMAANMQAPEWNILKIGAPELWTAGYLGGSVVVATLDTGVDALHPELAATYRGGTNSWFDPYGEHAEPYDRTGHGTQVMGLIVGSDASGMSIGVAPGAKWIAAKIFDDAGNATESAIHAAFQWLLDPDGDPTTDDAPDVVNNSWSYADGGICNSAFEADVAALKAADIAVVFSGGNFGPSPDTGSSPGNYAGALSAGSIDSTDDVSLFSSRGPSSCDGSLLPKLVAPGDGVQTTDLSFGGNNNYILVSGTSFAAPHVTGVLALLRDAIPPAAVDELEAALTGSAIDIAAVGPDNDSGYGIVNAVGALDLLAYPIDIDGDGYSATLDCNDNDATVFPGAPEINRDGIDQDCNGYDLSFKVHHAVYSHDGSSLRIRVTSNLREHAALEIVGVGPLTYREAYKDWFMNAGPVDGYASPVITLRGVEGDMPVTPRRPLPVRE